MLHRAGRLMWPLVSVAGFVTLLTFVTYGAPRLRAPLDVALLVLAAVPIAAALERLPSRRRAGGTGPRRAQAGAPVDTEAAEAAATRARPTSSASPHTTRYSWLRRRDTVPTRTPDGLWMPICAPT